MRAWTRSRKFQVGRLCAVGLSMVLFASACGNSSAGDSGSSAVSGPSTTTVGANLCLSGLAAADGKLMEAGSSLGVQVTNQLDLAGKGQKLALATGDSHVDPLAAVSVYKNLTSVHNAVAMQGCGSGVVLAMLPLAKQGSGVLLVNSAIPVYPALESPYLVSSAPTGKLWSEAMMAALQKAGITHPCLYVQQDPNGDAVVQSFKQEFANYGGSVACVQYNTPTTTNHNAAIAAMKSAHADGAVIYTFGPPATLSFMQEEKQLGFNKPVYTFDTVDDPALVADSGSDGLMVVEPRFNFNSTDPVTKAFLKAYQAAGDKPNLPSFYTVSFFNGVIMEATAVKYLAAHGKSVDGQNLKTAFNSITSFNGVGGTIKLDKQHNAVVPFALEEINNGKTNVIQTNLSTAPH
jgi:ABC-type branched-subunit amino acid transport system substrate-binding protein